MGTEPAFGDESGIIVMAGAGLVCTLLLSVVIGGLVAWFLTRAASVIPIEHRRIRPGMIWGLTVLGWVFQALAMIITFATVGSEGIEDKSDANQMLIHLGGLHAYSATVMLIPLFQLLALWASGILLWWVCIALPRGFRSAFASFDERLVPMQSHGRTSGMWWAVVGTIGLVGNIAILLVLPQNANPLEAARDTIGNEAPVFDAVPMTMSCGSGLVYIASLAAMICFLVAMSRSRTLFLELRDAPDTTPDAPPTQAFTD